MTRTAVITGASRGVGEALARKLCAQGGRAVLCARDEGAIARLAEELRAQHGEGAALGLRCDVAAGSEVATLAERALTFLGEGPQVLFNNAGVVTRRPLAETSEEDWDLVLDVNLKGAFLCARAFVPSMERRGGGRIVNVASISATLGTPKLASYCASKWGLLGLTKALAEELRPKNIQVLALSPGSIDTEMLAGSGFPARMTPSEVAEALLYLGYAAPAQMTGAAVDMFG